MSEDPIGFAAGDTNLYRYCGGDPVNLRDPSGLTATVDPNGNEIEIDLPMYYTSPYGHPQLNPALAEQANAGISRYLSGPFAGYNLTTTARPAGYFESRNTVFVRDAKWSKSQNNGARNTHHWGTGAFPGVQFGYIAAHEALHILGLIDLYIGAPGPFVAGPDGRPQPQEGVDPNNFMVGRGGTSLTASQIQTIIRSNPRPGDRVGLLWRSVANAMSTSGLPAGNPGFYYAGSLYASGFQAATVMSWDRTYGTQGFFVPGGINNKQPDLKKK